jgi:hypothetical protein
MRFFLAGGLGVLAVAAGLGPQQTSLAASLTGQSKLVRELPHYLARSRPTWPKAPEVETGSILLGSRRPWAISFRGSGVASFRSDSAFATPSGLSEDCTNWLYRHFFVGRDTIAFTYGNSPEACSESPRMIYRNPRGDLERVGLAPLFGWNAEAIWLTPRYLVFAATGQGESALPQFVRLVFWELETGRWFTSPIRHYLMHRPGFDLPALLPDWFTSRVYEVDGAVVLRGAKRGLAFWPKQRAWSIVDARSGRSVSDAQGANLRRVVSKPNQRITPALKNEIKSVFARAHDKANRDLVDFNIIDMIQSPCLARPYQYAVTARAVGRDRVAGGVKTDWSRELFGVVLLDSSLAHVVKSFPPFPSYRWGDTVAYFDLDAAADSIVVWEEGEMYADFGARFAYSCTGDSR